MAEARVPALRSSWRRLRVVLPVLVSVAVFAWLLGSDEIDLRGIAAKVDARTLLLLTGAIAIYVTISLVLEVVSLVRIVPRPRQEFSFWTAARIKSASYLAYIIQYSVGAGALTVLLRRRVHLSLAESAGVVLLIAAFDLGLTLLLAAGALLFMETDTQALRAGVIIGGGATIAVGFALLRLPISLGPLERLRDLTLFRATRETSLRRIAELVCLRLVFVIWFFAMAGVAMRIFGISVPTSVLFVNITIVVMVAALPIAVAGLGTSQGAFVAVFAGYADENTLFACSLAMWTGLILARAVLGLLFAPEFAREAIEAAQAEEQEES